VRVAWIVGLALLDAASARAERPLPTKINLPTLARPADPVAPSSRLIFMRRCGQAGCTVRFGPDDDSRNDTSSIADGARTIGAFTQTDAVWNSLMACMRATYAPFNIGVTDVDPGTAPHYEHIVGGHPQDLRPDIGGAGGVAPFTCGEIPNAISYTFDVYGADSDNLCWTAAQETAHAFGLEHETNNKDPLTYLSGPLPKRFQAMDNSCGEFQNRACECGNATQNSYMHIVDMFGPGVPSAPTVSIASPTTGKLVQPRFVTRVDASDDVAIDRVELYIDGAKAAETKVAPYRLVAPDGLAEGPHTVEARAFDVQGTPGSSQIDVDLGPPCTASKGCEGEEVCVMGGCVAGPATPGGLGYSCQSSTECLSGQCVADNTGGKFCVESCDLSPGSCPSGFFCLQAGDAGVCWASEDSGCCETGHSPAGPLLLGVGVLALALRRKRRS
jgi:hypothetical protein